MDDPWGSPWADEIQHPVITTKLKDNEKGNEVRLKPPVKAPTLGLEVRTNSPWDDEDEGFGEWAAVPTGDEVRETGLRFDGASDAWDTQDPGVERGEMSGESNGQSLSWNDGTPLPNDESPKLAPSLMPISTATARQPSPDPWAIETTLEGEDHNRACDIVESKERTLDNTEAELPRNSPEVCSAKRVEPPLELPLTTVEADTRDENHPEDSTSEKNDIAPEPAQANDEAVGGHDMGHESSRPSSSPSNRSHHDEILPESPRTSLDEEPKRSQEPRRVSAKIQGLVEHFDGLAKQEEEVRIEPNRSGSRSNTPSVNAQRVIEKPQETNAEVDKAEVEEEEADDEFGDFENGQSEIEEYIEAAEVRRPATPPQVPQQISSSPESRISSSQVSSPRSRYVEKVYGRVEFAANASALDKFASQDGGDATIDPPVEKVFIMDTIPYDSFTSTEERKTWYRISRYGSMRKHTSGNDENYVRATWSQSQVREQTLKTVSRWMEEDRISGRVILGGGSKGSSIFGWNDPNAPTVPLASAFAAKQGKKLTPVPSEAGPEVPREWPKGLVRDHSTSKSRSPPKTRRQSSTKSASVSDGHKTSPQAPVANFGWNASPMRRKESPAPLSMSISKVEPLNMKLSSPAQHPVASKLHPIALGTVVPVETTQSKKSTDVNGPQTLMTSKLTAPVLPTTMASTTNEDDDWGEMVASPVIAAPPIQPPSLDLRHKKSRTLNEAFSPQLQTSRIDSPISQPTFALGHKSTRSFNNILVPTHRNPLDSESDPFRSNTFTATSTSSFVAPFQASQSPVNSATSNNDPWASADFSFFDTPTPAPNHAPTHAAKPMLKTVSFSKVPPTPSPLRHSKTRQEIEQDGIVAKIVKSLPDLSYMMRR